MKKAVYIHQYFKTREESGAIRSYHIAKEMVKRGIRVEMITSHNKPLYEKKIIDGIYVHYLPIKYSNNFSFSKRYFAFIKFVFAAIKLIKKLPAPDLILATSTPLTVGLIALWGKRSRKIPYIFEVRDLWPDAPIQLGIIKSSFLKFVTLKLEKSIYKNAWKIIALSPGIEKGISDKIQHVKISMVPNMADIDFFQKPPLETHKNKDFVIGYFGAFGLANHVSYILEVAKECQKAKLPILFKLIGEGAQEDILKQMMSNLNLNNVEILPYQNRFEIKKSLEKVDACFTSFFKTPILETNSPNKFFDGLAAGKLSIVNTKGWLKELVEQNSCGFYSDPSTPEKFPELIKQFIQNESLLRSYQENALRLAKDTFSKEALVDKACNFILNKF